MVKLNSQPRHGLLCELGCLLREKTGKGSFWVDSNQTELFLLEERFPSQSEEAGPALVGDPVINSTFTRE